MNLTSSDQSRREREEALLNPNSVNIIAHFDTTESDSKKSKLNNKSDVINKEGKIDNQSDIQNQQEHYILCKKVRQAQQMKIMSASNMTPVSFSELSNSANITTESTVNTDMMMMPTKIPAKRKPKKDVSSQIKKSKSNLNFETESSFENQDDPNDLAVTKDELKEDFILPRERFISICNMDKNALDTYLNPSEENSPDLEMMQYFGEDKNKNDSEEEDLGQMTTSVPLLENYQLVHENRNDNKTLDKITQLRSMLEEHNQKSMNESLIKSLLKNNMIDLNNGTNQMTSYGTSGSCFLATSRSSSNAFQKSADENNEKLIQQSPNTRRKNLSFVPISNSARVRNINLHPAFKEDSGTNPFVSPRPSTITRRTSSSSSRNHNEISEIDLKSNPILGCNSNTAFCRPHQFKLEPVSAPESPSMIQNFNYSPQQHSSQNHFQFQPLNQNYNYPVESRSQSVPPHCTTNSNTNSNLYSANNNGYNGYSSTCSSMAPTPVPPEYQEFADSSILDIFSSEQQASVVTPSSIKLEASDDVIDLLDNEILNQNSGNQTTRQTFTNSRSVPSTPLPFHSNYSGNAMNAFCLSGKSVPTTPVTHDGGNSFRYSPELQTTRDFLINGFNNNNNNTVNHNEKILKLENPNSSNGIDDLSHLDTNCFNTL